MSSTTDQERPTVDPPAPAAGAPMRLTRKLRKVLLFPALLVVAYLVLEVLFAGQPPAVRQVHSLTKLIGTCGAFLGCAYAALGFERGAHMRRGWLAFGLTYACLGIPAVSNALRIPHGPLNPVILGANVLANLFGPYGMYLLSRTYSVAGIDLPWGAWTRRGGMGLGIGLGVLLGGNAVLYDVVRIFGDHDPAFIIPLIGAIGDTATLAFVAPIVLTAFALRGGLLAWPWMLLGASSLSWLLFDMSTWIPETSPHWVDLAIETLRILAYSLAGAAGVAQRILKSDVTDRS